MQGSFKRSLPIGIAAVFSVSFYAWGQLGGAQGIDVPFAGYLQDGPAAMTDDAVDFTFTLYDAAGASVACDVVTIEDVRVTDGRFATVIEDVAEACVKRKDPHLEVAVDRDQTGSAVALTGRQRIFPAVGAYTSGTGDFDSTGLVDAQTLNVRGLATADSLTVTTTATVGGAVNATGLVDSAAGVYGANAYIGEVGFGTAWAGFSNESQKTTSGYAVLQNTSGQTLVNSAPGLGIDFRVGNVTQMSMTSTGTLTTRTGVAPGSDEALRIVRGTILANATIGAGSGFSVARPGTGLYDITFSPAFSGVPSIVCTTLHPNDVVNTSGSGMCMPTHPNRITASGGRVITSNGSGGAENWAMSFIAIGPK